MGLKQIFEKQGGMKLLKQYWRGGAFFTAVGEFVLLGKSRTALEILRLSTQLKTKQKLYKRYHRVLDEFEKTTTTMHHMRYRTRYGYVGSKELIRLRHLYRNAISQ